MNYGEIRQDLISKGFAEESDLEEFDELGYTYDAINDAIAQIQNQFPQLTKYEFEIDESDTGILYIDMTDRAGFLELAAETPVVVEADGSEVFRKFSDYQVEMGHTIVMNLDIVPELPPKVHFLIPLLTAYYLWLDDDERKAVQYYNMYESQLALLLQKENAPRMRVVTEWGETRGNNLNVSKEEWARWH